MTEAVHSKPASAPRPSVLSLNINSKSALYAAFMPLLRNGGIFFSTTRAFAIGDEVFLLLLLMGDPAKGKEKLGWEPKITFQELVHEMVRADLEEAKREELCMRAGFSVNTPQE